MNPLDKIWDCINQAITILMTKRNQLDLNDPTAAQLDQYINILENRRSLFAELQVQQAISQLKDTNALATLQTLTNNLTQATQQLQNMANDLANIQQVIQVVASIAQFVLPFVAS